MTEHEVIEAKAFIDLHRIASPAFAGRHRFDCLPLGDGCAISLPAAPAIGLNRMIGLTALDDLDRAYAWMRGRTGHRYLQLHEAAAPDEVRDWVRAKGLVEHGSGWAKLWRGAYVAPPLAVTKVRTRKVGIEEAETFGSMTCTGFGFPQALTSLWSAIVGAAGWSCFFALLDDRPVGPGAMYATGGHAWLGGGATLPEYRGRGAQKALIHARLDDGRSHGVTHFVVETAAPSADGQDVSHANLVNAGFEQAYIRKNFRLPT